MGRILGTAAIAALMLVAVPATASAGQLKAGAAVLDASWHVGASAGQYASDGSFVDPASGKLRFTASVPALATVSVDQVQDGRGNTGG